MIKQYRYAEISIDDIFHRTEEKTDVADAVAEILADVRKNGDEALRRYSERFDSAKLDVLEVTAEERVAAMAAVDPELIAILEEAAANIRAFHEKQKRTDFVITEKDGVVLGQKIIPLDRAGVYVPGGTACYPSTVLMDTIPAKIAGVGEIIMTTPAKGGKINPVILAAAEIAGVDRIFKIGGAQAIGALAYGTESVPRVDKIVGPGNAFVAEAKKQVFGRVSIDMIAGPSEILILADDTCDAEIVAADMLSQAEHDTMASAVLVTDSERLADAVSAELERQIPLLPRAEIARESIDNCSKIILAESMTQAVEISNEIAPEHMEIVTANPFEDMMKVKNAGAIFIGEYSSEPLGDYFAGPNHVLPTNGTAKFFSALSVDDFIKKSSIVYYSKSALRNIHKDIIQFATSEQLTAHANSIAVRFEDEDKE